MEGRRWALLGLAAPIVLWLFTGLSVLLSPWFIWQASALSDLGNPANGIVAVVFNLGLEASGLILLIYSVKALRNQARKTSYAMVLTSVLLVLVGIFNEAYGQPHTIVSILMFVSLFCSSLLYFAEKKSPLALMAAFGMLSWLLYFGKVTGAAVPEAISWLAATPWIVMSAISAYYMKRTK